MDYSFDPLRLRADHTRRDRPHMEMQKKHLIVDFHRQPCGGHLLRARFDNESHQHLC